MTSERNKELFLKQFDQILENTKAEQLKVNTSSDVKLWCRSLMHAKDSQKIKIKKKTKTPRITDEGWNSQKRLSDPVEKKMKEGKRRKKRLLYLHLKLSLGLVPL